MTQFEHVIFGNLMHREDYGRRISPFLKSEYFQDRADRILFELIESYVHKFNKFPTVETLLIDLDSKNGIDQNLYDAVKGTIGILTYDPKTDLEWIVEKTERFCQEKAVYNGIMKSIQILDNKDEQHTKEAIPKILSDALAVSFDTSIGHSFLDDAESRFEFYHRKENRVPFNLEYFNKITKGGLPNKTLNVILAGCVHPDTKIRIRMRKNN
jgi:hypothetical protein